MRIQQYIVIKKRGAYRYSSRMTKGTPALDRNEIAVKVSLEIPDAIFNRPALTATIKVPEDAVGKPEIEAEVIDNVQDLIKQNTGFDVKLEVVNEQEVN